MRYDHFTGWYAPIDISHPKTDLILSNVIAAVIFVAVPIGVILAMQCSVRSFWDANAAVFGLLKGLVLMYVLSIFLQGLFTKLNGEPHRAKLGYGVFLLISLDSLFDAIYLANASLRTFIQSCLKAFLGFYRPFFIDACKPDIYMLNRLHNTIIPDSTSNIVWAPVSICTNNPRIVKNALESFPSGHTGSAFTVAVFLALYLNSKLKAFADFHTGFWKMVVIMGPVLGAVFVAGILIIDGVSFILLVCVSLSPFVV